MDEPSIESALGVDAVAMGTELTRMPHAYVLAEPDQHWVLLKCSREDQSVFLALDLDAGEGEIFPRRHDVNSYRLALDFLRTFT